MLLHVLLVLLSLTTVSGSTAALAAMEAATSTIPEPGFVGDRACASCHQKQTVSWQGSHHDLAMQPATSATVRGDFNNQVFIHKGLTTRFYRKDDQFFVETAGATGATQTFTISYTFGWEPLQQYLIDIGRGKFQALDIAWDVQGARWFKLNPDSNATPGDWLHWTGGAMNWNTMCADCHSTYLQQNYSADSDEFSTAWSSINVSCEACHGPGKAHVAFMASGQGQSATSERIRRDLLLTRGTAQGEQIGQCAACHSLRERLTPAYPHSGAFTDHFNPVLPLPPAYAGDGQIKEEVYVYGSFLQSRMYREGVMCSDCHEPHSLNLKATVSDNSLCLQCHEPRFNAKTHHFHEPATAAAQCVSCHMPGQNYMEIDFRRDHSFRIPRPDLTLSFGTPNACNGCHTQEDAAWASENLTSWYGGQRPLRADDALALAAHSGDAAVPALQALAGDPKQAGTTRAAAIAYLAQFADNHTTALLIDLANDDDEIVRRATATALAGLPDPNAQRSRLALLADANRAVRVAAIEPIAGLPPEQLPVAHREAFQAALADYMAYLNANEYFTAGTMNKAMFYQRQGKLQEAEAEYRRALRKDQLFTPARLNLVYLLNSLGRNTEARHELQQAIQISPADGQLHYSLALLLSEMAQLEEALPHFRIAADLTPANARMAYNLAVALQQQGQPVEAEAAYLRAIEIEPANIDYRYGITSLYLQQRQPNKARTHILVLIEQQPANPQFRALLQQVGG